MVGRAVVARGIRIEDGSKIGRPQSSFRRFAADRLSDLANPLVGVLRQPLDRFPGGLGATGKRDHDHADCVLDERPMGQCIAKLCHLHFQSLSSFGKRNVFCATCGTVVSRLAHLTVAGARKLTELLTEPRAIHTLTNPLPATGKPRTSIDYDDDDDAR